MLIVKPPLEKGKRVAARKGEVLDLNHGRLRGKAIIEIFSRGKKKNEHLERRGEFPGKKARSFQRVEKERG